MKNSLEIKIIPTLDSHYVDTRKFDNIPVYTGNIENEIEAPLPPKCFLGAWYRKVLSSYDKWLGIEGVVELGEFIPDQTRFNLDGKGRYMDNPSIYMGGRSDSESDCGLNYNIMYEDCNTDFDLTYASPKLGYRPFFRYIYQDATDYDGNVDRRNVNSWNLGNPRNLGNYYFPGDVIRMKVYSPLNDYLQLRIEVIKKTDNPKYVAIRKKYNLFNDSPCDYYSPIFYSKGHGYKDAEFKRVNSVDQYGQEGKNANLTDAMVTKCTWHECYLYREVEGRLVKVPFNGKRQSSMICPDNEATTVEVLDKDKGSESIVLHPGVVKQKVLNNK